MDEALAFVAGAFRGRVRKGTGVPYLTHLLQVATWVFEEGGDEEQFIAALLHDYVEDIEGSSVEEVRRRFGARVARIVDGLTDAYVRPKPPWLERKRAYLARLHGEPADVRLVAVCDKLHNASTILRDLDRVGESVWGRFTATKEQTLWYYREVTAALGDGWSHPVLERLRAVVALLVERGGAIDARRGEG